MVKQTASLVAVEGAVTAGEWDHVVKSLGLSSQQAAVAKLMLEGRQDKEIAAALGVTVPTVRTYLTRVFDRAQVKGRVQLAVRVFTLARACPKPLSSR